MKPLKFILITVATALLLCSCEKNEIGVKYYKHVTGKGCAFYKYLDGTIAPFANQEIGIEAIHERAGMGGPTIGNDKVEKTDANGNYTCRFVKSVKGWDMRTYTFGTLTTFINDGNPTYYYSADGRYIDVSVVQQAAAIASKKNPQIIQIDTIWIIQKTYWHGN